MFIHNALDELITCGETEIAAANMRIAITRLGIAGLYQDKPSQASRLSYRSIRTNV